MKLRIMSMPLKTSWDVHSSYTVTFTMGSWSICLYFWVHEVFRKVLTKSPSLINHSTTRYTATMPPKRRREYSESGSDSTGSVATPQKKVNAIATKLRQSTRTKPNGKLQTYSDIQNAYYPSSSNQSSNSDQPSSSEEQSSSEDESGANTDQDVSDQANTRNASSSAGSEDHSDAGDDADALVQAVERNGDKVWEILDGDERTSMKVGVEAPNRLRLCFRNRNNDEIREFNYKKDDPDAIRNIDWNSWAYVVTIGKWRTQIFIRLKFPVRRLIRWGNEEVMFLTLLHEKMALAAAQTKRISLPTRVAIVQLFMEEYGDAHDRDQVVMRIRRKDNGRLAKLKERLEGDLEPDGGPEYQLPIAEGELEAYMKIGYVRLAFDPAEYERILEARPEIEEAAKTRKTVDRKQKKSSQKPATKKTKTSRVVKTRTNRKTRRTNRVVDSDEDEPSESDEGQLIESHEEEPIEDDEVEPFNDNQNVQGGEELLHQFRNTQVLDYDHPEPGGHDDALEWVHRSLAPDIADYSDIRSGPSRTAHDTHDREEAQKKLLEARKKWPSTVVGSSAAIETPVEPAQSPDHPQQQPEVQTQEREASPETEDWLGEAYAALYDRIERLEGEIHLAHGYTGRNEQRQFWYIDQDLEYEAEDRVTEAPAVNALLNSAIVPPIGYHGDVHALVRERDLAEDELRLHELSQTAREAYHAAHDKEHADNKERLNAGKRVVERAPATNEDRYVSAFYKHLTESEVV